MINEHEPAELMSIAISPENKPLNRFQNIVPYDFNRVKLSTKPDYINASHIAIPVGDKAMKYIVCQLPVSESISKFISQMLDEYSFFFRSDDFWQMVAEQNVKCMIRILIDVDVVKMKIPVYLPTSANPTITPSPL